MKELNRTVFRNSWFNLMSFILRSGFQRSCFMRLITLVFLDVGIRYLQPRGQSRATRWSDDCARPG